MFHATICRKIKQLEEKVANFEARVQQQEEEKKQAIRELTESIQEVKNDMQKLKKEMKEFKDDHQSILAGQIASNVEAELRKIVLKDVEIRSHIITNRKTIPQIKQAIDRKNPYDPIFKNPTHKRRAKLNLKCLEEKFPRGTKAKDYYEIIERLKKTRNTSAHPKLPLDPDAAKEYMKDFGIESPWKEPTYKLLDLMKTIKRRT